MKKLLLTLTFVLITIGPSHGQASATFNTYFISPFGHYNQIRLSPLSSQGNEGDACPSKMIGTMYMNQDANYNLFVCRDDGDGPKWGMWAGDVWSQNLDNIYLTNTNTPESKKVGFGLGNTSGTANLPQSKLHLENDGGIIAKDTLAPQDSHFTQLPGVGNSNPYIAFMWYPYSGTILAAERTNYQGSSTGTPNYNAVVFGKNPTSARGGALGGEQNSQGFGAFDGVIGGGYSNAIVIGWSGTILGGTNNALAGGGWTAHGFIGGGKGNEMVSGDFTTIVGGYNNWSTNSLYSTIGGGGGDYPSLSNTISTLYAPSIIADFSTILGGSYNAITSGRRNTIVGGFQNSINPVSCSSADACSANVIGGGNINQILSSDSIYNLISGGQSNAIQQKCTACYCAAISGGTTNSIGDKNNTVSTPYASFSSIGGGQNNEIRNYAATISGGSGNQIIPLASDPNLTTVQKTGGNYIGGGYSNVASRIGTATGGGFGGSGGACGDYSVIGAGQLNNADYESVVLGGNENKTGCIPGYGTGRNFLGGNGINLNSRGNTFAWGSINSDIINGTLNAFLIFPYGPNVSTHPDPNSGFVGIGTPSPQERLHVLGDVLIEGGIYLTHNPVPAAGNPSQLMYDSLTKKIVRGNDLAETFITSETVEMGDVLVIDEVKVNSLQKSRSAYDKKIIGVVSGSPAILFEENQMQLSPKSAVFTQGTKPPVALAGRVPCKVSLENGPIERGDLLTSSSTPGYAMKATEHNKSSHAIVGKALEPFHKGPQGKNTGIITILVLTR